MLIEAYCKFFQQLSKPSDNMICQQSLLKMERQQPSPGGDRYDFATGKAQVKIHMPALQLFWLERREETEQAQPGITASTLIEYGVALTSSEEISPASLASGYCDGACKKQATAQKIVVNKLKQLIFMLSNRNRLKANTWLNHYEIKQQRQENGFLFPTK